MPISAVPRVSTGFFERAPVLTSSNFVWLNVIGRLQPGVTIAQASSAVDARYRQVHPPARGDRPVQALQLEPLNTRALGGSAASLRRFVLLLGGVVALTLLIGCANLANLLLARAAGRRREIGIRVALGAGRAGIVRQTLAESLLLAAIGGVAGLLVASLGLRVLSAYQLPGGVLIDILDLGFSLPALAATAGLSIVCGLLFGVVPAWQAARTDVMGSLRHDARVGSARGGMRAVFVAAQVALSLVLLTGSGLFLRSLVHAVNAPLGFEAGGVSVVSVNPGLARYDRARAATFYAEALARVRSMPQVEAAAWASVIPTSGVMMLEMSEIEGYHPQEDGGMTFHASPVGPEYFAAVGTRILAGRPFTDQDAAAPAPVVIVNEAAARKYWSGDAVGRRVKIGSKGGWATVVGVSENAKIREISERPQPMVYWPFEQAGDWELAPETAHLFVRSADASGILPLVAGQLRAADAAVPISSVRTLDEIVRGLVMPQRMGAVLFGCFSAVGLLLAAIGIYGVAAYVATQRTREFGIRMALGATRREIGRLMLTHGGRPVAAGLAAGLVLAAWTAGLATAFLHDVSPRDPVTFVAVAAILALVALAAGYLPARRAGRTDPVVALRHE
jgi:predicted permease